MRLMESTKKIMNDSYILEIGSTIPASHPCVMSRVKNIYRHEFFRNVNVSYLKGDDLTKSLLKQEIDIAFMINPNFNRDIRYHLIGQEDIRLICASDYPGKSRIVSNMNRLIDSNEGWEDDIIMYYDPYYFFLKSIFVNNILHQKKMIVDHITVIKNFLRDHVGVAILPEIILKNELEGGELVSFPFDHPKVEKIEYYVGWRKDEDKIYSEIINM